MKMLLSAKRRSLSGSPRGVQEHVCNQASEEEPEPAAKGRGIRPAAARPGGEPGQERRGGREHEDRVRDAAMVDEKAQVTEPGGRQDVQVRQRPGHRAPENRPIAELPAQHGLADGGPQGQLSE
jgi:hypothetical protein